MSDLHSLIRLRRNGLEKKQKTIARLYAKATALQEEKEGLIAQVEKERIGLTALTDKMREATDLLGLQRSFSNFMTHADKQIAEISIAQVDMEERIELMREEIRASFAELKKVEITQDRREEEEAKEQKVKEDRAFDDIAIEGFRRKE